MPFRGLLVETSCTHLEVPSDSRLLPNLLSMARNRPLAFPHASMLRYCWCLRLQVSVVAFVTYPCFVALARFWPSR